MRLLLTTSLLVLIAMPVANAATVLVGIDDGLGNCNVELAPDQGVVIMTLNIFTDLTLDGEDPNSGVSGVIWPGVFTDTGIKIGFKGAVDFGMNTHGRNLAYTQYGTTCGPTEDDIAGAGGIGAGIFTLGSVGPGATVDHNLNMWYPGAGSGKTYWAGVRVKVNTDAGSSYYTVSIDPASGLADAACTVEVNSLAATVAQPPWIPDTPGGDLNSAGSYASGFADVGYAPGCGGDYCPPMDGSFCIFVTPEPMALLLLAPGALLLRRRR